MKTMVYFATPSDEEAVIDLQSTEESSLNFLRNKIIESFQWYASVCVFLNFKSYTDFSWFSPWNWKKKLKKLKRTRPYWHKQSFSGLKKCLATSIFKCNFNWKQIRFLWSKGNYLGGFLRRESFRFWKLWCLFQFILRFQ